MSEPCHRKMPAKDPFAFWESRSGCPDSWLSLWQPPTLVSSKNSAVLAEMVEIILKIYAFGFVQFISKLWNIFDFLVIGSAFIISIVEECKDEPFDSETTLDTLLVLRVLRIGARILLHRIENARWICLTPDHDVETIDLAAQMVPRET